MMTPNGITEQTGYTADMTQNRWNAVLDKNESADGTFVFAVKTTGIYCRPSCPSKPAKRENVIFFDTTSAAQAAGFRACKRCRPDGISPGQTRNAMIEKICNLIQASEGNPTLAQLAADMAMSPHHLQHVFKEATGITPKTYWQAIQKERVTRSLEQSPSVTDAIYDAGFNSSGRFYEASDAMLGMTPKNYRKGGEGEEISYAVELCTLGYVLVGATSRGICAVEFGDSADMLVEGLHQRFSKAAFKPTNAVFKKWVSEILRYIEQPSSVIDLPLDIQGTIFQQRVWKALQTVPVGQTVSYTELAAQIGSPKAIRAVASACAANELALLIPCHRAVRANGELSGYRWGLERKAALLRREKKS